MKITRRAALAAMAAGMAGLQSQRVVAAKATENLSYYAPSERRTFPSDGIFWTPSTPPVMTGEPRNMVVVCDYARRAYGLIAGRQAWVIDFPNSWPRGVCLFEGRLYIVDNPAILVVDPVAGRKLQRIDVPAYHAPINSVHVSRLGRDLCVTIAFDRGGVTTMTEGNSVHCLRLVDGCLHEFYRSSAFDAIHPRDAALAEDGTLVVSDTFGALVVLVDTNANKVIGETPVYYPNTVQMLDDGSVLICSEHANRVTRWHPKADASEIVFSAPVFPFSDAGMAPQAIRDLETNTADQNSDRAPKASLCSIMAAGRGTLYSPNSARLYGDDLLIADTDNHRVIVVRGGEVVTEVTGFNNPVNALLIPA